jgi:LacI family transcriptional regulator
MVTQRQVAERAGVSFITVSRVINGRGNVKKQTRLRIEKAIRELGYYPNSQGRALNSGRTSIIGVIAPVLNATGSLEGDTYYSGLLEGVELACRVHRYDLLLSTQRIYDRDFDYLRLYSQKKVDGTVLFGDYKLSRESTKRIEREHIPIVVVGDRPESPAISWVDMDNETGGYASAARLIACGHRRIAFLGVTGRNANVEDRLTGVRRALSEKGMRLLDKDVFRVDIRDPSGESLAALLSAEARRTAVVCGTDALAVALLSASTARGIRVPQDLSMIGFDGIQLIHYTNPPIDTNRQPLKDMGFAAAEILFQRIEDPKAPPGRKVFDLEEMTGGSVSSPVVT